MNATVQHPDAGYALVGEGTKFPYDEWRKAGWSDAQLIADGKMAHVGESGRDLYNKALAAILALPQIHPLQIHDDPTYPRKFWRWLVRNEHVWKEFIRWSRESKKSGRKRYSASAIVHRMRWDTEVVSRNRFKMSDSVTPYLSRLLMAEYPEEFAGYFTTHSRGAHIATDLETGEETEASLALAESEGIL